MNLYGDPTKGQGPSVIYGIDINDQRVLNYSYDSLYRTNKRALQTTTPYFTTYGYVPGSGSNQTTTLLQNITNNENKLSYTYDAAGNILTISENEELKTTYTYDLLNQLKGEIDHATGLRKEYSYDNGGNITYRADYYLDSATGAKEYVNTVNYAYNDSIWKDKLTSYNGTAISYDEIGNPLTWRDNMTFAWQNGRKLSALHSMEGGDFTYRYNEEGQRIQKINGNSTTEFYYNGSQLLTQVQGNTRLDFMYDASDSLLGFRYNGENYYYIFNGQNDIIGILDKEGAQIVSYTYDAWGIPNISGDNTALGCLNPFLYRGYYYDYESGLYYLNSRYYDPVVGRFLNPDKIEAAEMDLKDFTNKNLYAYCDNSPVSRADGDGHFWHILISAGIGAAINAATYIVSQQMEGKKADVGATIVAAVAGAVSGGLAATGFSWQVQMIANGITSGLESIGTQLFENKSVNLIRVAVDTVIGGALGAIGGKGSGGSLSRSSKQPFKKALNAATHNKGVKTAINVFTKSVKYMNSQTPPRIFFQVGLKPTPGSIVGAGLGLGANRLLSKWFN